MNLRTGEAGGCYCPPWSFAGHALRDCLRAVPFPYIEVHMTNIEKRGLHSILAEAGVGVIAGFGVQSYVLGLEAMLKHLQSQPRSGRVTTSVPSIPPDRSGSR